MKKTFIFSAFFIFIIFSSVSFAFEPSSNTIYNGIDVSQWQRNINFSDVADDNIYIVYIKATQGNNYIDPYFEKNYANAKKNNLKIGVYHYLTARSIEEAIDRLTEEMLSFARNYEFEKAANIRDFIKDLKDMK